MNNQRPLCEASTCRNYGKNDLCYIATRGYRTCINKHFPKPIVSPLDHFPDIVDEEVATEELVKRVRDAFGNLEGMEEEGR